MSADRHPHLPLVGEPLALDLINTVVCTPRGDVDLLDEPAALVAWLDAQAERLPAPGRALTPVDLRAVHAIRAQISAAIEPARQRKRPPAQALRALTAAQRAAPEYRELGWDGRAVTAPTRRAGAYTVKVLAHLAESATDLLTSPDITRVRQCQRPDCILLFLPAHPRRRWCSATCGNRARVARYYQRHNRRD